MSLLFALPAADTCMQSSFEFEDVDVQPSRDEFVKRTVPERFRKKVLKFLDQGGGPTLERADDRQKGQWMQACAEKGFLLSMIFHRCVAHCPRPSHPCACLCACLHR